MKAITIAVKATNQEILDKAVRGLQSGLVTAFASDIDLSTSVYIDEKSLLHTRYISIRLME